MGVPKNGYLSDWRIEAQRTLTRMDKLEEILYERVADLANMKREKPKAKLIREKQAIRKARRDFLLAQDQMQMQTKALCRPLCEAIHERLPQELRDMIVRYLITENSATFLTDKDGKVSITNGLSTLQYAFEEEFTGAGLHAYIIYELMTQDARFHFRTHHELLDKVFKHYAANEYGNLDLASKMKRLSLVVTERHLKDRQAVLAHLEALTKLSKGAEVLFIIDTGYCTQAQAIRQVRRVLRMMFGLLEGLHKLGLHITVVISPIYSDSEVDHSRVNPLFLTYYVVSKAVLASHSLVLISESGSIQHRLSHTSPSL